jgi:cathepsin H
MLSVLACVPSFSASASAWASWKLEQNKVYASPAEHEKRQAIFMQTLAEVSAHNAKPGATWKAGLNEFADLTWDEFKVAKLMTPQNCSATHVSSGWKRAAGKAAPAAVDWRVEIEKTAPWPVKSQGHCGSCWTFSTVGSMESHYILKHAMAKNLSEQQLVDCAGAFNNFGCNGGLPSQAFEYLHYAGGHDTESTYPYTAVDGPCAYDGKGAAQVAAVNNITAYAEDELYDAIGTEGPVSIAYQVAHDFRYYHSGVYDGDCETGPGSVNHAVVAVGYGTDAGVPYYIVRNSWGDSFGEDGYFRIVRNKNKCGLSDCASFPTVA